MTVTTDFTSGYQPPGVYIGEQSNTIPTATGLPPVRLVLIGRGQGGIRGSEQISLIDDGVRLAVKGILESTVEVTSVSNGAVVEETEYTVQKVTLSESPQDHYLEITRVPSSETVPEGTTVWVTYESIPVDYFAKRTFTNAADISNVYGPGIVRRSEEDSLDNPVNSPLTLASEIAFANGASEVILVPLNLDASADSEQVVSAISAAYDKVSSDYAASVIVPLTDGLTDSDSIIAAANLRGHVASASNAGYYRIGIFGQPSGATSSPAELVNSGGVSYERMVVAYASEEGMIYRSSATGERIVLGHQYLAAAYGGRMVSLPVQQSLTRQRVAGFAGVGTAPSVTEKNAWAHAGVALTEVDRQGRVIIRHGTSTDRSNLVSSEPSLIRARDTMVGLIQTGLDNSDLIGSAMTQDSPLSVKSIVSGVLEYCKANGTFVDYNSLQARIAQMNPSIIEVRFAYRPAFPLNYIMVTFSVDLSTGEADMTETASA